MPKQVEVLPRNHCSSDSKICDLFLFFSFLLSFFSLSLFSLLSSLFMFLEMSSELISFVAFLILILFLFFMFWFVSGVNMSETVPLPGDS